MSSRMSRCTQEEIMSSKLLGSLVALSIAWSVSAQTPVPKPKPAKKAPVAVKPAGKAEPAPAPEPPPPPPPPPPTDVRIQTKYINGAQISENTTYFKGVRQRFEFPGITMISQCDLKRTVQLHDATRHYMVVSTDTPAAKPAATPVPPPDTDAPSAAQLSSMFSKGGPAPAQPKPQGVVAETITLVDTGERKKMFGLEARHIKTVMVRQPDANACDSKKTRMETDGWYVDLPEHASCSSTPAPITPPAPTQQACADRVETRQVGAAKLGFALTTAMTTTTDDGKETEVTSTAVEVTDLQVTALDAALFDVPPGFSEVQSYQQLLPSLSSGGSLADAVFGSITDGTSTVAPKKPGVIRIGIVAPTNKSGRTVPMPMVRSALIAALSKAPFEALPIAGPTAADLDRNAAAKACDFILVSEIAELKTSKPNKVGGLMRRASGDAAPPGDVHDARVDYKLFAVGDQTKPRVAASAKGSSGGGFGLSSALRVAAFAGSMYMTMGMGNGMMMNMMGSYGSFGGAGAGGGIMSGLMNPGMGAAMSMMSQAQMMGGAGMGMGLGMPGMEDASNEKAIQTVDDTFSKVGKQVAEELKKGKSPAGK